jgi:hypothetical protein
MALGIKIFGAKRLQKRLQALPAAVKVQVRDAVSASLLQVQNDARRSLQKGPKSGRTYRRGDVLHRASAPGQAPATDTGGLVSSINHLLNTTNKGLSGTVGVHASTGLKYALRMEFGGRDSRGVHIAPRPFMSPAYKRSRKGILKRINRVLPDSMKRTFTRGG